MQHANAFRSFLAIVLCLTWSAPLTAQKTIGGALRGRVLDQSSGAPIASALIEFMDGRTRIRASTTSDADGNFALSNLPSGSFRLRVTRIGYVDTTTPY